MAEHVRFAFESTLCGLSYTKRFARLKKAGYVYKTLADSWAVYDSSGASPKLFERSP